MKSISTIAAVSLLVSATASFADQAKTAGPAPAAAPASAGATPAAPAAAPAAAARTPAPAAVAITPPADYVIGAGDVLIVTFWKEPDMTTDAAIVRPDGMITIPLLNDVPAAGLKPEQLSGKLVELATAKLFEDPRVTVGVRAINSRKVFISGAIGKPGPYDLHTPINVLQLISLAGGLREFTSGKNITIIREEGGKQRALKFNHEEVQEGKRLEQNIQLKPGDTVVVPE
jgi:polysaccharide export outer membrane protein